MPVSENIEMLCVVAKGLGSLKDEVVFVGGATVDLHVTDPAAPRLRNTDDVDCVVEITSRHEYHALEERLTALGFEHPLPIERAPICRRVFAGIKVDVMPTDEAVLGFNNHWYPAGMTYSESKTLPDGQKVATFSLPYFVASKIEAFHDRGKGDYYASTDLEDIIAVLDGAGDFNEKILATSGELRNYLKDQFVDFIRNSSFVDSLTGHLAPEKERANKALATLQDLAEKL